MATRLGAATVAGQRAYLQQEHHCLARRLNKGLRAASSFFVDGEEKSSTDAHCRASARPRREARTPAAAVAVRRRRSTACPLASLLGSRNRAVELFSSTSRKRRWKIDDHMIQSYIDFRPVLPQQMLLSSKDVITSSNALLLLLLIGFWHHS